MTSWKANVYILLGFLGSIISLVLFIQSIAPHLRWTEVVFAVFFGFCALLGNFAFFTLLLPQEYRIILGLYKETNRRSEQI
jgi:predicted permease